MGDEPQSLTVLSPALTARILRQAGSQYVTEETVRNDIAAGAPAGPDDTVNLIAYAAWLVREVARGA